MNANEEIELSLRLRVATAEALLRETLEHYAATTTEAFSQGCDRAIREKIARFLDLNPAEYCLWITTDPPTKTKRSRQAREIQRRHATA